MKRIGIGVMFFLMCVIGLTAHSQEPASPSTEDNQTPLAKLRADMKKAVENGNLTDAQKETMKNASATLRAAAQAKQNGEKVDRSSVKKALADIKKVVNSNAFRPEDQQAVKADMEAVKEKIKEARQGRGRRGLFRQ